jgi:outer membrane protein OmpA-like peptidoglycan-associated protein
MGGFDIFVTKRKEDGTWETPKNIGWPVNSPDNDVFFVVSGSGRYGYYSSFRSDGYGEKDLYRITFLGPEKQPLTSTEDNLMASLANPVKEITIEPKVEVKTVNLAILKGLIRDARTLQPVEAKIELIDNEKNELVTTLSSDSKSGNYLVSLPAGKNYGISVKADGYLFHSENVDIPKASGYREYEKNIDLKKVEVGQTIVLRNIFFDLDKATLRDASRNELERLIKLLNENPTLRIEISGHTDTQGDAAYNQKLSEARAKAVVDYLIKAGIAAGRLEYKGYGESQPQIPEADILKMKTKAEREEAHQQNRRTEFKILSK